jgi:hypothetical protein
VMAVRLGTEQGTNLSKAAAAACGRGASCDPTPRAGPLFHASMVLRHVVGDIAHGARRHLVPTDVADRPGVSVVTSRRDAVGNPTRHRPSRAAKRLGCGELPGVTALPIDQVPVPINGPVEIRPPTLDAHGGFIAVATFSNRAATLLTSKRRQHGCQPSCPVAPWFRGEDEAPREKPLGQVPPTQLVPNPSPDHQTDAIGGRWETIVGRPGPCIETALARATAETAGAQVRAGRAFGASGRLTVGARHHVSSFRRGESTPSALSIQGGVRSDRTVPLAHGDVVVWGGPARLRYHGVMPLKEGHHPLMGGHRINLTCRKAA